MTPPIDRREAAGLKLACRLVDLLERGEIGPGDPHNVWGAASVTRSRGRVVQQVEEDACGCELCQVVRIVFPTRDEWQLTQGLIG